MICDVRISLLDDDRKPFMGIGLVWLLERIDQYHSISRAAREMHMSYPKAIRIIKSLESGLQKQIVIRRKGGNTRGGAVLTEFGREFIERYTRMQQQIKGFAVQAFEQEFGGFLETDDHGRY
jgi:molybdate transport system regulatory protein